MIPGARKHKVEMKMCGLCAGDYVRLCAHHYVRLCVETLCADYVSVLCRLCVLSEKIKFIPDTIETSKITPTRAPPPAEEPWPPTSPEKATQIIQTIIEHKQNHTAKGPHHTHTGGEAPPALHLPCPSAAPTPPWNSVEKNTLQRIMCRLCVGSLLLCASRAVWSLQLIKF